ncbi:protein patched-like, partial [Tropilaelaps mercedesae]
SSLLLQERADGNQASLWLRSHLQIHLYETGCAIQRNPGKILFVGLLILTTFCVGLKSVRFEYELEKLWIEEGGRVTRELEYVRTKLGVSAANSHQIIIQTPSLGANNNVLHREAFLTHVELLQQALQVEVELYEQYSLHNADWSIEKAREIIEAWQHKFTNEVKRLSLLPNNQRQRFNVFTFGALTNVLRDFTKPNVHRLLIGTAVLVFYVCLALVNLEKPELSQACAGFFGVLLLVLSITAAFGLCTLLGLTFNATTTQILPLLSLGLGCNSIFLLTHTLNKIISSGAVPIEEQTGECLKRTGVNIILSNVSLVLAFAAASIIPIPALRYFSLQAAILLVCSLTAVLLLFPAVFSIDLHRRAARRLDFFCCIVKSEGSQRQSTSTFPAKLVTGHPLRFRDESFVRSVAVISVDENKENELRLKRQRGLDDGCFGWSVSHTIAEWYVPLIHQPAIRALVVLSFIGLIAFGLWGTMHLEDGLELSELIPTGSDEYEYLQYQQRYFRTYRIFAVTQANFEYPTNQRLLYEYHDAFTRVEKIVKNDNGGLPEFWLSLFRDWLLSLQKTFDLEWNLGYINQEGWNQSASNEAILAYKLLVQTGRLDNPVDKSLVTSNRLVKEDGIINPKAFYYYLTAWYNSDPLAYSFSQASLVPQPKQWDDIPRAQEFKILKSPAIHFAQFPFYLRDLNSTRDITATISHLRSICAKFEERGLPNFPTGLPLVYWEQYLHLRFYLAVAILLILAAVFIMVSLILFNLWSAVLIVLVLCSCVLQILGALHSLNMSLSAVPAVLIIISIGLGVDTVLHLSVGYLTALGCRARRVTMALEYMSAPIVHATFTTLLAVTMLAFSEFDFVIRYFSYLLSTIVAIYAYNSFVVLPVLLTLIGPPGELVPRNGQQRIEAPTVQPSPAFETRNPRPASRPLSQSSFRSYKRPSLFPRTRSEMSLSTITEESSNYQSTSPEPEPSSAKIVVEPEITVETTTVTNTTSGLVTATILGPIGSTGDGEAENNPSPTPSSVSSGVESGTNSPTVVTTTDVTPQGTNVTTKVTTTAKVKVELHAPSFIQHPHYIAGPVDYQDRYYSNSATFRPPSRRSCRGSGGHISSACSYGKTGNQSNAGRPESTMSNRNNNYNSSPACDTTSYQCYYSKRS